MTCILKYLNILTFPCLWWGATEGSPFSKAVLHSPVPDLTCLVKFTILPKDLAVQFCFINDSTALQSRPFISTALTIIISSRSLYLCLVCFRRRLLFRRIIQALGRKTSRTFYFPRQRRFQKNIIIFELHWPKRPCTHKLHSKLKQFIIVFRPFREKL